MCDSKRCKKCNEVKPLTEFYSNGMGSRMSYCKKCKNEYTMNKYNTDPEFRQGVNDRANKRLTKLYHTDPEFRQKVKDKAKQYRKRKTK